MKRIKNWLYKLSAYKFTVNGMDMYFVADRMEITKMGEFNLYRNGERVLSISGNEVIWRRPPMITFRTRNR